MSEQNDEQTSDEQETGLPHEVATPEQQGKEAPENTEESSKPDSE